MSFDQLQKAWQSQENNFTLTIDSDSLLKEVKRNKEQFESAIFWRNVREIGVAILLAAFFLYDGIKNNLWPMCLLSVLCLWVGVFMAADRILQKRKQPKLSDTLLNCIKNSLVQINHQIWLLKNVLWWYLLPPGAGIAIFLCYISLETIQDFNGKGSLIGLVVIIGCFAFCCLVFWGIYLLNQRAVKKDLIHRKFELKELLSILENQNDTSQSQQ